MNTPARLHVAAPAIAAPWLLIAFTAMAALAVNATTALADSTATNEPSLPASLTLEWCLERALAANPALAMAEARALTQEERVDTVGTLDDPRFSYEASNIPIGDFDFASTPLSGHQLSLRQKLPLPGLLTKRERAANHLAASMHLLARDQRLAIDAAVESTWAELGFAQQARDITHRNIDLLRQLAATAESRYRVGSGLQQDVLRAQVELTELLRERLRRDEAIELVSATLAALLDLPPDTHFPAVPTDTPLSETPTLSAVIEAMGEANPRLASAERRVEEARLQIDIAEAEGLPDFDLGVGYRSRRSVVGDPVEGDDFVSAGLTVRLPVNRSKWRAHARASAAKLREAEADRRALRGTLAGAARREHARLVRASSEEELIDTGLLPLAVQSLEASRTAYEVGRVDFLHLLDSQVKLLDAELRLARARADKRLAFAALESAVGEKLR